MKSLTNDDGSFNLDGIRISEEVSNCLEPLIARYVTEYRRADIIYLMTSVVDGDVLFARPNNVSERGLQAKNEMLPQ